MKDKTSAALLAAIAGVMFILWYRRRNEAERSALVGGAPAAAEASEAGKGGSTPLDNLLGFAATYGLLVSPNPTGGTHVPGSLHYQGRAVDVTGWGAGGFSVPDIQQFAKEWGIQVIDERNRPKGEWQWTRPHLHLQIPVGGG